MKNGHQVPLRIIKAKTKNLENEIMEMLKEVTA